MMWGKVDAALVAQSRGPALNGQLRVDKAKLTDQSTASDGVPQDGGTFDEVPCFFMTLAGAICFLLLGLALLDIVGAVGGRCWRRVAGSNDLEVAFLLLVVVEAWYRTIHRARFCHEDERRAFAE